MLENNFLVFFVINYSTKFNLISSLGTLHSFNGAPLLELVIDFTRMNNLYLGAALGRLL